MHNTEFHSTNPTHPTGAMNYNEFLDEGTCDDLSPFDAFMEYDECGNSTRLDGYIFSIVRNIEPGTTVYFKEIFDASFTDLLWPEEEQRLLLDLIMFTQRYPEDLELLCIDPCHDPVFIVV